MKKKAKELATYMAKGINQTPHKSCIIFFAGYKVYNIKWNLYTEIDYK